MKFTEFTISTTSLAEEIVADILWQYTTYGVAVCDYKDVVELIENRRDTFDYLDDAILQDKPASTLVKAYVELSDTDKVSSLLNADIERLKENSAGNLDVGTLEITKRQVDGDDWIEIWKKHFKPICYGKIVVCPKWINYTPNAGEKVVYIDSNMAFGTGEHETTSMCVLFLEKYVKESDVVLDVGCGSGILGITASKLGAKEVIMTDIDECAVTATEHNMELNDVKNCKVYLKNLLDDNSVKGDVIVCNIMAEVLIAFAPKIGDNLKENGVIILSGILTDRKDKVRKAYEDAEFVFDAETVKGEWAAMAFRKGV